MLICSKAVFCIASVGVLLAADPKQADPGTSITRSVVGIEQAGGSSANGDQKLFLDVFHSYALPFGKSGAQTEPGWRWWANIRIASYPQQIGTTVGQLATGFANQLNRTPVNQLAQFGEFRTGVERRVADFQGTLVPSPAQASEKTSLGFFVYFGSLGSLSSPAATAQVFQAPPDGTPQSAAFQTAFPAAKYPALGLPTTQYIAFTTPARDRFFRQYGAGFRLTTRFFDSSGAALPGTATLSVSFGQNEFVTGGMLRGIVGTFEAFYPIPLGSRTKGAAVFYLFGRTDLRLGGPAAFSTPLALIPAPLVPATNPNVAIIALPSNRDVYTIGIGIDAVQLILSFKAKPVQ